MKFRGLQHQQGRGRSTSPARWPASGASTTASPSMPSAPGFFPSKMTRGTLRPWARTSWPAHAPLRRMGDDDDLKGAALLFASAAGKHITGQILAVDGGVSCVHGDVTPATSPMKRQRHKASPFPVVPSSRAGPRAAWATRRPCRAARRPGRGPPQQLGGGPRRRADDDAGRGHGHAARSVPRGHGGGVATVEMKTSFMRPAQGTSCGRASCCTRPPPWPSAKASVFDDERAAVRHATGTFKYLRGAGQATGGAMSPPTPPPRSHTCQPADPARLAPHRRAQRRQLPLVETAVPDLQDGQVLVRHHYLSLDPYMRGA
jgi:hypothetical protein